MKNKNIYNNKNVYPYSCHFLFNIYFTKKEQVNIFSQISTAVEIHKERDNQVNIILI